MNIFAKLYINGENTSQSGKNISGVKTISTNSSNNSGLKPIDTKPEGGKAVIPAGYRFRTRMALGIQDICSKAKYSKLNELNDSTEK